MSILSTILLMYRNRYRRYFRIKVSTAVSMILCWPFFIDITSILLNWHAKPEVSVFLLWRRKSWKCRLQPFLVYDIFATTLSYYSTSTTPLCSVFVLRSPAHPHWSLQCDCYKSINIEVSISISILLRQSIDIGIDDTFKAGISIEYRRYFWKISITTLVTSLFF